MSRILVERLLFTWALHNLNKLIEIMLRQRAS